MGTGGQFTTFDGVHRPSDRMRWLEGRNHPLPLAQTLERLDRLVVVDRHVSGTLLVAQVGMLWPDTGRDWIAPSPGLPGFDSALAYSGMVLFEATSINYGTGTRQPFYTVGAPWADGPALAAELGL